LLLCGGNTSPSSNQTLPVVVVSAQKENTPPCGASGKSDDPVQASLDALADETFSLSLGTSFTANTKAPALGPVASLYGFAAIAEDAAAAAYAYTQHDYPTVAFRTTDMLATGTVLSVLPPFAGRALVAGYTGAGGSRTGYNLGVIGDLLPVLLDSPRRGPRMLALIERHRAVAWPPITIISLVQMHPSRAEKT